MDSISLSLRMARAQRFAQAGRWREAEAELSPDGGMPADELALHAWAVVVTQSGDFPRALHLWRQLLQRDPGHDEALRMVDAIVLWQSRPSWYAYIPHLSVAALVALLLPLGFWLLSPATPASTSPSASKPAYAAPSQSAPLAPRVQTLQSQGVAQGPLGGAQSNRPAAVRPVVPAAENDSGPSITFPKPAPRKR